MLLSLSIRDLVLIDALTLEFDEGMHVLSGETGAGKSILLDALRLALGARGDASLVRSGVDQASVSAVFCVSAYPHLHQILSAQSIQTDGDQLIFRRVLSRTGRTQAYINDQLVSLALMKELGDQVIEIHGQFDRLFNPQTHRHLLDEFAQVLPLRAQIRLAFKNWKAAILEHNEALQTVEKLSQDEELLRHQLRELEDLVVEENEEEVLLTEREALTQSGRIEDGLDQALTALSGTNPIMSNLISASKSLQRIKDFLGDKLDSSIAAIDRAEVEVDEAINQILRIQSQLNRDSRKLEDLEERLHLLRSTARKHSCQVAQLPTVLSRIQESLAFLDQATQQLDQLDKARIAAREGYVILAQDLHQRRVAAADHLDNQVTAELPALKLEHARFLTQIDELSESNWGEDGLDRVEFMIATNKGQPPSPLAKTASGGELSRLMLALKVVLTSQSAMPTIVFDEIDSGVGGATSAAIGERLLRVSTQIQVLTITHSPQIAALARHHYRVFKKDMGDRMSTHVVQLTLDQRREEIARMLSGETITPEALAAADRLLEPSRAAA